MRDIVIVRGPQGSGKSSLIRAAGLEGHHLSFDRVREVVSGDWMSPDGRMGVSQQHNQMVRAMTFDSLRRRMAMGETIAFEATLPGTRDVKAITDLADEHGYRMLVVDLFGLPIDAVKTQNAGRPDRVRVSNFVIERCYAEAQGSEIARGVEVVRVTEPGPRGVELLRVRRFLEEGRQRIDLSAFERVVMVGDLQGTLDPLLDPASPLAGGLRDDTAHIFCGDLFDRGVQNAAVARFWIDHCHERIGRNVWLVAGNHEDHLERQARGLEAGSREWRERTWPQLLADGLGQEHMAMIAADLSPFVRFGWRGVEALVSHGGFPVMPTELHLLPEHVLRRGAGEYGRDVDARWDEAQMALPENERIHQAHGHRNSHMLPVMASRNGWSANLEGGVEFGGHMRFVTLDASGWTPTEIRSKEYRTMVEAHAIDRAAERRGHGDEAPMTPWALRGELQLRPLSEETLAKFRDHAMIGETVSETRPTVSSWNFTKAAFYTRKFDAYTEVARGLFVDNVDGTVISRGARKFYNAGIEEGERPETSLAAIIAGNHGKAQVYAKENGFFCTVGYSERLGELVVTSKSRIEGTFPDMANAMIDRMVGAAGRERMLRFCRDQKACLMFEVVDMTGDPHIIKEPGDKLVLLACIRRDEAFEQVPYDTLTRLATWIGCAAKQNLYPNVTHPKALEAIIRRVATDAAWRADSPVEGVVIEFEDGWMVKVKAVGYAAWKVARGAVERLAMARRKGVDYDPSRHDGVPLIGGFLQWALTLPTEALGLHIIQLRDAWTGAADADFTREQVEAMGARPGPKVKDMSGYEAAIAGMAARVEAGQAKHGSVAKMLAAGEADGDKRAVLDRHPAGAALRAFVADAAPAAA